MLQGVSSDQFAMLESRIKKKTHKGGGDGVEGVASPSKKPLIEAARVMSPGRPGTSATASPAARLVPEPASPLSSPQGKYLRMISCSLVKCSCILWSLVHETLRAPIAQSVRAPVCHTQRQGFEASNAWKIKWVKRLGCHGCCQEVDRCHTRGDSGIHYTVRDPWCSCLTFAFDSKDQRKTQTMMLSVNKALQRIVMIYDRSICSHGNVCESNE